MRNVLLTYDYLGGDVTPHDVKICILRKVFSEVLTTPESRLGIECPSNTTFVFMIPENGWNNFRNAIESLHRMNPDFRCFASLTARIREGVFVSYSTGNLYPFAKLKRIAEERNNANPPLPLELELD